MFTIWFYFSPHPCVRRVCVFWCVCSCASCFLCSCSSGSVFVCYLLMVPLIVVMCWVLVLIIALTFMCDRVFVCRGRFFVCFVCVFLVFFVGTSRWVGCACLRLGLCYSVCFLSACFVQSTALPPVWAPCLLVLTLASVLCLCTQVSDLSVNF